MEDILVFCLVIMVGFCCIMTARTMFDHDRLTKKIAEQQKQIDDLKRKLEGLEESEELEQ